MKECELCSDEHNRRSPYCSTACKQADWRRRQSVTDNESVTPVTVEPKCNKQVLHPAILDNILRVCTNENGIDEAKVKVRMAAALRYAKMFPNKPCTIIPPLKSSEGHIKVPQPSDVDCEPAPVTQKVKAVIGTRSAQAVTSDGEIL